MHRYKNAQMIFSAFRHLPQLAPLQPKCSGPMEDVVPIPPIRWWQETIEAAWRQGQSPPTWALLLALRKDLPGSPFLFLGRCAFYAAARRD